MTPAPASNREVLGSVRVYGNRTVDEVRIIRAFGLRTGNQVTVAAVRQGMRRVMALGLFADVSVGEVQGIGGHDLIIYVRERPDRSQR